MARIDELTANEESRVLCLGNEAIARGAIEAGVQVFAAYPGTPSSEASTAIIETASKLGHYAEWSTNEKVAFETAYAALKPLFFCGSRTATRLQGCKGRNWPSASIDRVISGRGLPSTPPF